jgi:hypothetical protein
MSFNITLLGDIHRVDIECQAFSPVVRIGTPPPPHPGKCVPTPYGSGGRTHLLAGEGVGGSQF